MENLRPELNVHLHSIPAYDKITIINSYIHKNYGYREKRLFTNSGRRIRENTKYRYYNMIDLLEDSTYLTDSVAKYEEYGTDRIALEISDLKSFFDAESRVFRIPKQIEKTILPRGLFSDIRGKITVLVEGSTSVYGGYIDVIKFADTPNYVSPSINQVFIEGRLVRKMTDEEFYIDAKDFEEYLLVANQSWSSYQKINIKINGKNFDNIIDFPNKAFKDESCFDGIGKFEKAVIYPINFNKKCPIIETKILVLKEGIEGFVDSWKVKADCITLCSTLKTRLNEVFWLSRKAKSIEIPSILIKEDDEIVFSSYIENVIFFGNIQVEKFKLFFDTYRIDDCFLILEGNTIMIPKGKNKKTVVIYEKGRIIVNN